MCQTSLVEVFQEGIDIRHRILKHGPFSLGSAMLFDA